MIKLILSTVAVLLLLMSIEQCQAWNETDASDNGTMMISPKPFVYYGRYHHRRVRREYLDNNATSDHETLATILSILPLDRLGTVIGQIFTTTFKEMLSPNVGKKILHVLENQAPSLVTSLFTNLYSTFRAPVRSSTSNATVINNRNGYKPLSNTSSLTLIRAMKRVGMN